MPLGSKLAPSREVTNSNIGTKKVCSYDAPGLKTGAAARLEKLKHGNKEGKLQNSSPKPEGIEL